jgi:hypothetical protein
VREVGELGPAAGSVIWYGWLAGKMHASQLTAHGAAPLSSTSLFGADADAALQLTWQILKW